MSGPAIFILLALAAIAAVVYHLWISNRALHQDLSRMREKTASQEAIIREESRSSVEEGNRLVAILESMTEGVIVVDPDQKILLVNSALAQAFSIEKKGARGRYFWEMFRDPEINTLMRQALEGRRAFRIEHEVLLSHSTFDIQLSPVLNGADFLGMVAVFRDITMLKEFDRLRSEFVANVSHELKTPLTSILGFVETLKEGAIEDPENRLKFLQVIEDQSKHLHALIEDLLFLSKLEASKEPLRLEPVDLAKLTEKIRTRFAPLLKDNRLTLDMDLGPVATALAEASSLERALSNLVDNAVKYNRPNGRVRLETAPQTGGGVAIRVIDTGMGIAPHDMNRIFERFYRSDKSRSRELGGTGLGLSIVKHIVERHGGRVDVESVPGEGSVFTLFLPK